MRKQRTTTRRRRRRIWPALLVVALVVGLLARAAYRSTAVNEWLTRGDSTVSLGTMHDLRAYAKKNGFDASAYPESLIRLYERNKGARQFVLDYPLRKDDAAAVDLSELAGCTSVPLLLQWDER